MFRRIAVTGSGAVAGSAVRAVSGEYADSEFIFMRSADCDLTDPARTLEFFAEHRPDAILHLAAVSGGIGLSADYHATMLRDNVLMGINVLDAARRLEVGKVVMTLTAGAYPPNAPLPLREASLHDGWPADNNYGSSFAKRLLDPAVRAYRAQYGLAAVSLIPGGIFGEHDNFHEQHAPMVPTLIRRFFEHRDDNRPIVIWGDGTPRREYTFSHDIARIFLWALEHYDDELPLNIGSTEEHSIAEIAGMLADAFRVDRSRIVYDSAKPNGVFRRSTDNSRFIELSGFRYTPFAEGLRRTIDWFCEVQRSAPQTLRTHGKARDEGADAAA